MHSTDPSDPHAAIPYTQAAAIVADYAGALRTAVSFEDVSLVDALGRVLAEPVFADRAQPPFARSTRDGFACRAAAANGTLHVIGLLKAGEAWTGAQLGTAEAIEIMTGAPLPAGADCVVMVEHITREGDQVRLAPGRRIDAGDHFIPAGAEAQAGATLVREGARVRASHIAAAASAGRTMLRVHGRPRVAILATGDELVPLGEPPLPWQIRNSNSYSLAAQVLALGADPVLLPIVADTAEALGHAVRDVLAGEFHLLLLTGGVSMGKYDLVEDALASLGGRFLFTGIRMQPGKPVVFGEFSASDGGTLPFFGLPGNPVSTMVTFALFAAPVLAALAGERGYAAPFAEAQLAHSLTRTPNLRRFLPGRLTADADKTSVAQIPWQGSGDIAGTAQANCLIIVPEVTRQAENDAPTILAGESVRILLL